MQVWAVARQMISEGIRMKLALVFLMLIALVVLGLPFSVVGDSSLTGAVQSFMSYGLTASAVLLGMLTVFMSRSLSDEFVHRQIYITLTKPIPRWQFILGKWLGITSLNAVFLITIGLTIYGMVFYIKVTHPPIDKVIDEKELANEVLVARHAIRAQLPDFRKPAEEAYERNREQGKYNNVPNFDPEREIADLASKFGARWRLVAPREYRDFTFKNVLCDRSPDHYIQVRYKTDVTNYPPDEILRAMWRIGDPYKDTAVYDIPVRHVVGRYQTIRVPADAVAEDHTLSVRFSNENPFAGEKQYFNIMEFRPGSDVEVLFVVGSFEGNLLRLMTLIMCKLMFLAAVAVFMATMFSFPVACLTSFTVYILAGTRTFLFDSLDFASNDTATMFSSVKEFLVQTITHMFTMIGWVIPDFGRYDAVENLVNGRNVSLVWVLQGIGDLAILKTAIVLGLAMLLFYRREVAEVSV